MKNFEGTKGKWSVYGTKYFTIQNDPSVGVSTGGLSTIATVNTTFVTNEEAHANAQLIATAPELLGSLIRLVKFTETLLDDLDIWDGDNQAYKVAKETISKALGKEEGDE